MQIKQAAEPSCKPKEPQNSPLFRCCPLYVIPHKYEFILIYDLILKIITAPRDTLIITEDAIFNIEASLHPTGIKPPEKTETGAGM